MESCFRFCNSSRSRRTNNDNLEHDQEIARTNNNHDNNNSINLSKKSQSIDEMIKVEARSQIQRNHIVVLLLGASESGKSTILKQIRLKYGVSSFTPSESIIFRSVVYQNIITIALQVINTLQKMSITLQFYPTSSQTKELLDILNDLSGTSLTAIPVTLHQFLLDLWNDRGVLTLANTFSRDLDIMDSAFYWFPNEIPRVLDPDYMPTTQDILNTRVATVSIHEYDFDFESLKIRIVDVGGTRSQRNNWLRLFQDCPSFIFLASLSNYEKRSLENDSASRITDSLDLFEAVINHKYLRSVSIILFLNKVDLFRRKLDIYPLQDVFPDYLYDPAIHGDSKTDFSCTFIKGKFVKRIEDKKRPYYCFITCATDTKNVQKILGAITEIWIKKSLINMGIMSA